MHRGRARWIGPQARLDEPFDTLTALSEVEGPAVARLSEYLL